MSFPKQIIAGVLVGGWLWSALCGDGVAQVNIRNAAPGVAATRGDWQQRVLRRGRTKPAGAAPAVAPKQPTTQWAAQRRNPVRAALATVDAGQPDVDLPNDPTPFDPLPPDAAYDPVGMGEPSTGRPIMGEPGVSPDLPGCSDCVDGGCGEGCEDCGGCYEGCGECYGGCHEGCGPCGLSPCGLRLCGLPAGLWSRDLSLFAGVHGFKGPPDLGRNGNFGFQEGVNFGSPIGGPLGIGFQVGMAVVHSNFCGDQADQPFAADGQLAQLDVRRGDRDQIFFTTGLFRRAVCGGLQGGVVFDLLHDVYYDRADLAQIRTEIGYVFSGGSREIGYFGAYGTRDDSFRVRDARVDHGLIGLDPTDMFAFYYRRYANEGGEGRFWAGFTGRADALLGADLRIPIGRSLALENRINYLLPRQGHGAAGQPQESWGLTIQLVWHPGRRSRCMDQSPFRPLFGVADNATFMSDVLFP